MPVYLLADAERKICLDQLDIGPTTVHLGLDTPWSVRKRTLRGGLRDGVDIIEVDNGALTFSVLPTRGMGLWRGRFRDISLGWQAPVLGPVHPKFVDLQDRGGLGWLQGFDEWLCRCGLNWNGPPGDDGGRMLTLHGRIANQPAHKVEVILDDDPPRISVRGEVDEGGLFYSRLRLTTTYTTEIRSNRLEIEDQVTNLSAQPAEMQLLYHCNLGPPLLGEGSRVRVPFRELWPLTARAAEGIDSYDTYSGPTPGFAEQVYACFPAANSRNETLAMLHNAKKDRAMVLRWNLSELPCFTIWKNTAAVEDGYVTGLEPATNFPNFKAKERAAGRVVPLAPQETWRCRWSIEVLDSAETIAVADREINEIQARRPATIVRNPPG